MQTVTRPTRITHPWVAQASETIRFGLAYGPRSEWRECRDLVQEAEALGFDSYWTMDHPTSGVDCWTLLSALAVTTSTIRLGVAVNCVLYRPPTLLARMAADVDRLSRGRLILERKVLLQGRENALTYLYAESVIVPRVLPAPVSARLLYGEELSFEA